MLDRTLGDRWSKMAPWFFGITLLFLSSISALAIGLEINSLFMLIPICLLALGTARRFPEYWFLAILIMSNTIFKFDVDDSQLLEVAGYGFLFHEIAIALLAGLAIAWRVQQGRHLMNDSCDLSFWLFFGLILLLLLRDVLVKGEPVGNTFGAGRSLFCYLCYLPLVWHFRTAAQVKRLLIGILLLAILTSGIAMTQFMVGHENRIIPGTSRVESLTEDPFSPTRVLPIGLTLVLTAFCLAVSLLVHRGFRQAGAWLVLLLCSGALFVSFTRGLWVGAILGTVVVFALTKTRLRAAIVGIGATLAVVLVLNMVIPEAFGFAFERILQGFGLQGRELDASALGRLHESRAFLREGMSTTGRILLGTGIVGNLNTVEKTKVTLAPENGFVHLFYFGGLAAVSIFFNFCFQHFRQAVRFSRSQPQDHPFAWAVVGLIAAASGLLVANVPALLLTLKYNGVILFTLCLAICRVISRFSLPESALQR